MEEKIIKSLSLNCYNLFHRLWGVLGKLHFHFFPFYCTFYPKILSGQSTSEVFQRVCLPVNCCKAHGFPLSSGYPQKEGNTYCCHYLDKRSAWLGLTRLYCS